MTLYRPMRADADGRPVVARERWALGVRIEGPRRDLTVISGVVGPLSGGMSVALDWHDLLRGLIPREFGGTNRRETMFSLVDDALPTGLNVRRDGPRKGHYVIEPRRKMPIEEYEALLQGTQDLWERVIPP